MSTEDTAQLNDGRTPVRRVAYRAWDFAGTVGTLVHADVIKLSHYWVIVAGYGAMFGIAILGAYLVYHLEQAVAVTSGSGYAFAVSLVLRCVDFAGPILYVMICILFAIEVSNSTIKCILTRPVTRMELIISKYITAMIMIVIALIIFWAIGLLTGWYYYGLGSLALDDYEIFSTGYMYKEFALGTMFLLIPFAAVAAMALMVSTYSSTMGGAIIIGLIAYFFFQILGLIPVSLGITLTWGGEEHLFPYMTVGFPSQRFVPMYMMDGLPTGEAIEIGWQWFDNLGLRADPDSIAHDSWWKWDMIKMIITSVIFFAIFFIASVIGVKKRDFVL